MSWFIFLFLQGSKLETDTQDSVLDLVLSMNKTLNNECVVVSGGRVGGLNYHSVMEYSVIYIFIIQVIKKPLSNGNFDFTDSSFRWPRTTTFIVCSWKLFDYCKFLLKKRIILDMLFCVNVVIRIIAL
jgi:hypothetical protein